jgi:NADH:ubiquinone oxidoreductase subunit K
MAAGCELAAVAGTNVMPAVAAPIALTLAVIVGIGSTLFGSFTGAAQGQEPTLAGAMSLVLAAITLFGLGIFGPAIATGLVSGAPQLGAGAAIGTAGVFVRRNLITILLSIEIMLNAVNLTFVAFGRALGSADGQIIVFFVMTVAAAEAAVGLAIVISLFRHRESLNPDSFASLKW